MGEENQEQIENPFADRWEEIERDISLYLTRIGAKVKSNPEVMGIIALDTHELRGLTAEQCGENSFILSQYAFYLQQEYNFHKSKVDWAEDSLNFFIFRTSAPGFINKEVRIEKVNRLAASNKNVKLLLDLQIMAKVMVGNLEALSFKIGKIGDSMESLQQTKRRHNG